MFDNRDDVDDVTAEVGALVLIPCGDVDEVPGGNEDAGGDALWDGRNICCEIIGGDDMVLSRRKPNIDRLVVMLATDTTRFWLTTRPEDGCGSNVTVCPVYSES